MGLNEDFARIDKTLDMIIGRGEKALQANYLNSLKEMRNMISKTYEKYADATGNLSMVEMQKFKRLQKLNKQVTKELNKLMRTNTALIKRNSVISFNNAYFRYGWAMERNVGLSLGFNVVPIKAIEASVNDIIGGATYDDRMRLQTQELISSIRQDISQGLISGDSLPKMAKRIKGSYGKSLDNLDTILRTENNRNANTGILESYEEAQEAGVDLVKQWVASLDNRTRAAHAAMDGKKANEDGMFKTPVGLVSAPMVEGGAAWTINCRCRTIAIIEGLEPQLRRDGDEVQDNISFKKWAKDKGMVQNKYGEFYKEKKK